jgi:hypothetical protein
MAMPYPTDCGAEIRMEMMKCNELVEIAHFGAVI